VVGVVVKPIVGVGDGVVSVIQGISQEAQVRILLMQLLLWKVEALALTGNLNSHARCFLSFLPFYS